MSLASWTPWLAAALLALLYARLVILRNRRLVRPPVLGADGAPLAERTLRLSDGEVVAYLDVGPREPDGSISPTVLLIPGADGMKETFRFQFHSLSERHRVLCADLRAAFAPGDTLDRLALDVLELADEAGAETLVLVGQSLGGAIAMRFAVLHPARVAGLAAVNSLARVGYEHVGLNRALLAPLAMATTRYLPTALGRGFARLWSRLEVWIFDASPGGDRVVQYALWTGPRTVPSSVSRARVRRLKETDLRSQLPSIRTPSLVVKGPRDHYVPPAWSHEIASLIPCAEYAEVPGTGHCSHLSMPGTFNRVLGYWLSGLAIGARVRVSFFTEKGSE
ncbi:MAG TPA: alpha/beta hydrolase [Longimicrobiales bacterium]|nr:alpha/beta hydrolase [Longimicrobiales bacterium]